MTNLKRTKIISALLAAVMLLSLAVPAFASSYADVKDSRWSRAAIEYVTEKGYMNGVSDGKFDPAGSMTRAMFVTVLWRRENSPAAEYRPDFSDVKSGKYYSKAVIWAKDKGIVSGVTETSFDPDGKITREQLATMLYRYCSVKNLIVDERGDLSAFADKGKIHSYAADALSWAVGVGLIGGVTKDKLDPRGLATREQVATILKRFDEADIPSLADQYRQVVESIADHAAAMLDQSLERRASDPSFSLTGSMNGTILLGLVEAGRFDDIQRYVDAWIEFGDPWLEGVDGTDRFTTGSINEAGLLGYAVLALYEHTGDEKYAAAARSVKDILMIWPTTAEGEIKYTYDTAYSDVYVDGTGMVTPFLARYAADFGGDDIRDTAVLQVDNYLKYGIDPAHKLVNHGYGSGGSGRGEMGWGRGTGWLMLAVGGVMEFCDSESTNKNCDTLIGNTFRHLSADNTFAWSLSDKNGASDSSATGMIMWGVMKAKQAGHADSVSDATVKAIAEASLGYVTDGVVYGGSGPSGGFGSYSDDHNENNGWSQGGILAFLAAYVKYLDGFPTTENEELLRYYRPYVEQMADHAEVMLQEGYAAAANQPDDQDFLSFRYGMLILGLIDAGRYQAVADYVELWLNYAHRDEVCPCDPGLIGYAVLALYEKTGDEKYADLCREFLASFDTWPTDKYGEIKYDDDPTTNDIYVDGTGMVTPFLARYADVFGDEEVRKIAALQADNYLKYGIDPAHHLANHGYNLGVGKGETGWGRGTGWLMLAVGSVMRYCGDDEVNAKCETFLGWTFKRLKDDNKFGWTLFERDAPSDTSATGMIMWGVMKAKEIGLATTVSDETIKAIAAAGLSDVRNGVVYGSSGESGGWGSYSENYNENNGWGQGGMLGFYALLLKYLAK